MKKIAIVCCIILVAGLAGCKSKTEGAAAVQATEVESFTLAKDFEGDEAKAASTYKGKPLKLKDLVIETYSPDEKKLTVYAFNPSTKEVSIDIPAMLKGEKINAVESGNGFFIQLVLANPDDASKVAQGEGKVIDGKNAMDFQEIIDAEGVFETASGNEVTFRDVKIIKK